MKLCSIATLSSVLRSDGSVDSLPEGADRLQRLILSQNRATRLKTQTRTEAYCAGLS